MIDFLIARVFFRSAVLRLRSIWMLLFVVLDLLIVLAARGRMSPDDGFRDITRSLVLGFILPITAMLLGTAIIREEVERGTLGYWLTRPVHRLRFAAVRLVVASLTVATVLVGIYAVNVWLLAPGSVDGTRGMIGIALGSLAYTCFFAMLGVLLKRPFIVGSVLMFLVDFPVSQLPMSARYLTIRGHVENVADLTLRLPAVMERMLEPLDPGMSGVVLLGIAAAGIWITGLVFRRLEFTGSET